MRRPAGTGLPPAREPCRESGRRMPAALPPVWRARSRLLPDTSWCPLLMDRRSNHLLLTTGRTPVMRIGEPRSGCAGKRTPLLLPQTLPTRAGAQTRHRDKDPADCALSNRWAGPDLDLGIRDEA